MDFGRLGRFAVIQVVISFCIGAICTALPDRINDGPVGQFLGLVNTISMFVFLYRLYMINEDGRYLPENAGLKEILLDLVLPTAIFCCFIDLYFAQYTEPDAGSLYVLHQIATKYNRAFLIILVFSVSVKRLAKISRKKQYLAEDTPVD